MSASRRLAVAAGLALALAPVAATALVADFPVDLAYTPLVPCRVLDTRPGGGVQGAGTGPLAPGSVVNFDVAGLCGVPELARAAMINVIAVGPAGPGHLTMWPWDDTDPPPLASVINYATPSENLANGLAMALCDPAKQGNRTCSFDVKMVAAVSATHVVIDVLGYFAPPHAGRVWGEGRPGTTLNGIDVAGFNVACSNEDVSFMLSTLAVEWSDAEAACPAGWWVCTANDRGFNSCDTTRQVDTSGACDYLRCDSGALECVDAPENSHRGWVASVGWDPRWSMGFVTVETGATTQLENCSRLPVWCCRR